MIVLNIEILNKAILYNMQTIYMSILLNNLIYANFLYEFYICKYYICQFYNQILYMPKYIIANTETSNCHWSRNGNNKSSSKSILQAFLGLTVKKNLYYLDKYSENFA